MSTTEAEPGAHQFETSTSSMQGLHEYMAMANVYDPLSRQWAGFSHEDDWMRYMLEGRILDLGSGVGERFDKELQLVARAFGFSGAEVHAVNPDYAAPDGYGEEMVRVGKQLGGSLDKSVAAWADALPYRDGVFRGIFAVSSLGTYVDPVQQPDEAKLWLGEMYRVLDTGGFAFVGPANQTTDKENQTPEQIGEAYEHILGELEIPRDNYRYSYARHPVGEGSDFEVTMLYGDEGEDWTQAAHSLLIKKS